MRSIMAMTAMFVAVQAAQAQTTLSPPVRATANTAVSGNVLTVTQTGQGRAILGTIDNASSRMAAIRGQTNGAGVALHGASSGTKGSAGKFEITNPANDAPGVTITTAGDGHGLTVSSSGGSYSIYARKDYNGSQAGAPVFAAIYGENMTFDGHGNCCFSVGIEGHGNGTGVVGVGTVLAGVSGRSASAIGVEARSESGTGLSASSATGLAGDFGGKVNVSDTVTARGFLVSSDRDAKQGVEPVNGAELLDRIASLDVSRWSYKSDPSVEHIGPMAQDFHAAFQVGADDKHIGMVDAAGVSLAAIRALVEQLRERDALIAQLAARITALESASPSPR